MYTVRIYSRLSRLELAYAFVVQYNVYTCIHCDIYTGYYLNILHIPLAVQSKFRLQNFMHRVGFHLLGSMVDEGRCIPWEAPVQ